MSAYGFPSSSGPGSAGESVPMPVGLGADYLATPATAGQLQAQQQQSLKKAKDIPVSHGRNLLRKRMTVNGASPTSAAAAPDNSNHHLGSRDGNGSVSGALVNGLHVVGNGTGPAYVPSSNASAALFASKADTAGMRPPQVSPNRSQTQTQMDARAEWESKMREKELQKEREREWKREMAIESQLQKEREREMQKEKDREREKGGRKLSKRR